MTKRTYVDTLIYVAIKSVTLFNARMHVIKSVV